VQVVNDNDDSGWWTEVLCLSQGTSLAFLEDEPDLYTLDDGEPA
jgi:hypothetical protein